VVTAGVVGALEARPPPHLLRARVRRLHRTRRRDQDRRTSAISHPPASSAAFVPETTAAGLISADRVMAMTHCPVWGVVVWTRIGGPPASRSPSSGTSTSEWAAAWS
jgi:hypothetical protein